MLGWLDAFLISGLFSVVIVIGLGLLLHLELGLARIANFGVVGFYGIGMYVFGVLYVKVTGRSGTRGSSSSAPPPGRSPRACPASSSAG